MITIKDLQKNIKLFYIINLFIGLVFMVPIWVNFERRIISNSQMAMLEVLGTTMLVVMQLPTGALADLIGRKNTMILGWFISAIGNIGFGLSQSFSPLVLFYVLCNLGAAFVSGADVALLYDTLKEIGREQEFQSITSKKGLFFQISIILATLLGGYFYNINPSLPYIGYSIALLGGIIVAFFLTEPDIDTEKFTLKSYSYKIKDGFKEIFKTKYLKYLSLFYILVGGITWSAQLFFIQVFATDIGFSVIEKSWFFAILRLINSVVFYKVISRGNLINEKRSFLLFPIMMIMAFLPGAVAGKIFGGALVWLAVFAGTARFIILDKYLNDEFASRHRATALSALGMIVSIIYILLMLLSGPIMQVFSSKAMFSLLGILSIIFVLPLGIRLRKLKNSLSVK